MFGAFHGGTGKAGADLKTLGGGQAEGGLGEVGLETVEDGFAEAGGAAADDALDDAAEGVAIFTGALDGANDARGVGGVGPTNDVGLDVAQADAAGIGIGNDVVDLLDVGDDVELGGEIFKDLAGDGGGGDATDGFTGGGATAAVPVTNAEFGLVGVVGVGGAVEGFHLGVGFGAVVLIADHDGDRGSGGEALKDAGEILLWPGRRRSR